MLVEAHRRAAEDIEKTILPLQTTPHAARVVIEGAWGAAFHWIAFGCETKHQSHQESHARLGTFLRHQGEKVVAEWWENLEHVGQGGGFGKNPDLWSFQHPFNLLARITSGPSQQQK